MLPLNRQTGLKRSDRFQVLWLIIRQIFASESGMPHFNALVGGDPLPISHKWYIAENYIDSLEYIYAAESIGVSSTTFT